MTTTEYEQPAPPPAHRAATTDAVAALLATGVVTAEQVAQVTPVAAAQGVPVLQALIEANLLTQADAIRVGAESVGLRFVELAEYPVDVGALACMDGAQARRLCALPVGWADGGALLVAVTIGRAGDLMLQDDLRRLTGASRVQFVVATKADITAKIDQVHRAEGELAELTADMGEYTDGEDTDLAGVAAATEDAPIVRFVNLLITQAIADRASDIHIEPGERDLHVRYRIDGVLHEAHRAPKSIQAGVISRLKIMAEINIAERRVPQDGRLSITHGGTRIDLRVATLPTVWGEKVVMRILDSASTRMELSDLGFAPHNFDTFRRSFTKPYGMILVTGPTGSGKSTTLYATLNILAKPTVNVITVEDPVEYRVARVNQVQTNPKAGLTFASALRSILRSDPDIVLIGEIRDHETARIAVEAALTGHLVLSTLHTNDAPSAVTRLVEMGVEPFLVGSALDAVVAQRLCRRLCGRCRQPYQPTPDELVEVGFPWTPGEPPPTLHRAAGCSHCAQTGYRGRTALHEVMPVSEAIERLAVARASADDIRRAAVAAGMKTLREDGWLKVLAGDTSIEEILRVVA